MKKILAILAFSVMAFAMVGCGKSNNVTIHFFKENKDGSNYKKATEDSFGLALDDDGYITEDDYKSSISKLNSAFNGTITSTDIDDDGKDLTTNSTYSATGAGTKKSDKNYDHISKANTDGAIDKDETTELKKLIPSEWNTDGTPKDTTNRKSMSFKDTKDYYVIYSKTN